MNDRICISKKAAIVIGLALLVPAIGMAQTAQPAAKAANGAWIKKTPAGQPDLQGFWSSQTTSPLERDPNCGTKEFWTEEEMAKNVRNCARPDGAAAPGGQRGRGGAPA